MFANSNYLLAKYCFQWTNRTVLHPPSSRNNNNNNNNNNNLNINNNSAAKNSSFVCHLTAGLYPNELYIEPHSSTQYICSTHNEIFFLVLRYLGCSIGFEVASGNFGGSLINGSWTGILALIASQKVDFIPHIFSPVNQRDRILQTSELLPAKDLVAILSFPKADSDSRSSPWIMFNSFSGIVWTLAVVFFLAYGLLNWHDMTRRDQRCSVAGSHEASTKSCDQLGLVRMLDSFVELFALLLGQGTVPLSSNPRQILRNPLIMFIFASVLLRQLFSTDITALLLSTRQHKIDRFDQLFEKGREVRLLMVDKSTTHFFFIRRYANASNQIYSIPYMEISSIDTLRKLIHENYVLVATRERAELIQRFYSTIGFHISSEGFALSNGNYAVRKSLNEVAKGKLTRLFKHIFLFGLETQIDKTIEINNFHHSLQRHYPLSSLSTADILFGKRNRVRQDVDIRNGDSTESRENVNKAISNHNSPTPSSTSTSEHYLVVTFVFIYSIGITISISVLAMESILYYCFVRREFKVNACDNQCQV